MTNNIVNLIRMDFSALLSEGLLGFIFIVLLAVGSIYTSNINFESLFLVLIPFYIYIAGVFGLDEKYRTERFFTSLPVRSREIVFARYCEVIVMVGVYIVLAYLANNLLKMLGKTDVLSIPAGYFAAAIMIVSFVISLSIPLFFTFGRSRAAIPTFLLILLIGFALNFFDSLIRRGGSAEMKTISAILKSPFPKDIYNALILIGIAVLFLGISIPISVSLYSKKEL